MATKTSHDVVCFGEVLWDILPSGPRPGGAPMNVAYHLKKLGNNPAMITRTGTDDYGKKLEKMFLANDMRTDFFQTDDHYATGLVYARPNEFNEVTYEIVEPVAWDFIEWKDEFPELMGAADYFVFGSLTSRSSQSRETLYGLLEIAQVKVLDINLRPPHFQRSQVEALLEKADVVKMNIAELKLITGWFSQFENTADRIKLIQDTFRVGSIIVTMGSEGAVVSEDGKFYEHPGYKVKVIDTIGSGDAFLAGYINQMSLGRSVGDSLSFACAMGAFMATYSGACPYYEIGKVRELEQTAARGI
jgi:fructokinase